VLAAQNLRLLTLTDMMEEDNEDGIRLTKEDLSDKQQHQIRHRELFLSRQVETLPATHIRGKCSVTLLNETESLMAYLNREACWQHYTIH
jgi:metastasis-associated protein MTA